MEEGAPGLLPALAESPGENAGGTRASESRQGLGGALLLRGTMLGPAPAASLGRKGDNCDRRGTPGRNKFLGWEVVGKAEAEGR